MKVPVVVDNRVRIQLSALPPELVAAIKLAHEHPNPGRDAKRRLAEMMKRRGGARIAWWKEPERIQTWREKGGELSVPRGGLPRVRGALLAAGLDYKVEDRRSGGAQCRAMRHLVPLYPFQKSAAAALLERQQGILRAGTGSGKSTVLLSLVAAVGVPSMVIVHSGALHEQWFDRARGELGLNEAEVGVWRGGSTKLRPITIAMQQTLARNPPTAAQKAYFGAVMADEVHKFAARTFLSVVDAWPARYRFGASADESRRDSLECLVYDLFGDVVVDVPPEGLVASGHVMHVQVRVLPTDFRADWYGVPGGGLNSGNSKGGEREIDFGRLVDEMASDAARNDLVLATTLAELSRGEQVFLLTHRRAHAELLLARMRSAGARGALLLGGADGAEELSRGVRGMRAGETRLGVGTYQAVGTGVDVPSAGVVVCATPIAANRQYFGQVRGRVCRVAPGKRSARLVYIWDREVFGAKHLENLARWNSDVVVDDPVTGAQPARQYLSRARGGGRG